MHKRIMTPTKTIFSPGMYDGILLRKFGIQLTFFVASILDFLTFFFAFLINYERFDFFSHFATMREKNKSKMYNSQLLLVNNSGN